MYKVISLSSPTSDLPKDVEEFADELDAKEYAYDMKDCGHYVVVYFGEAFKYSLDGRLN
jgi:hypothetical protein